jgi:hypothetical protein
MLMVSVALAQKVYFVYLESESQQPFFAKLRDKTYTSSASGYLILSNLRDSSYIITIGFPADKWPEQRFTVPTRAKDRGFLLKNFGEKGWGLFDLQTLSIQMSEGQPKGRAGSINQGGVSAFTALLSKAANDPSLLESPALAKNENKLVIVQQAAKKEDVITGKEQPASNEIVTAQTRKEVPDSQKGLPASNTVAINQSKKVDANAQKEQPATNEITNDQTKKEVGDNQKGQPAMNAVAVNQTKKEDANTPKEQPATNSIATDQTKNEFPDSQKGKPAANTIATDQAKKVVPDSQKGEPAPNTIAIDQTKKGAANTQKEQPDSNTIAADQTKKEVADSQKGHPVSTAVVVDQTKKVDSSAEMAKATEKNTNATKIGEQEKKPESGVTTNPEKADKSTVAIAVNEKKEQVSSPVTTTEVAKKTASPEKYKRSLVTKKSESSTTDGFGLVFIDQFSDDQKDTIEIFIPNPKEELVKKNDPAPPSRKFLEIGNEEKSVAQVNPVSNKSCSAVATDKDFFNLRKKMAALVTDDAMINESRKSFKSKCYTTEQIKNLGSLFLKESGKFQFYEAAYPFSSDQGNFVALQSDFKDNYFIYRFKKLVN